MQGKVTGLRENCDDEGCTYSPVVLFSTQNGRAITFKSKVSSNPPSYDVGETVTVVYAIDNPEEAVIKGRGRVLQIGFMIIGGITIFAGLNSFSKNVRESVLAG